MQKPGGITSDAHGITASGPQGVETFRMVALRSGLALEIKTGMKLSRGMSASQIITEQILKPHGLVAPNKRPNKTTVYRLFNDLMVQHGYADKPLD